MPLLFVICVIEGKHVQVPFHPMYVNALESLARIFVRFDAYCTPIHIIIRPEYLAVGRTCNPYGQSFLDHHVLYLG